jgi:CRP-like cAMP-binding protein
MSAAAESPTRFIHDSAPARKSIALFEAEPDLLRYVQPDEVARATKSVRVPLVDVDPGVFEPGGACRDGVNCFGAMVVSGLVSQQVALDSHATLRLLGPGDMFSVQGPRDSILAPTITWAAGPRTQLALLDDHLLHATRRWPRVVPAVVERALDSQGGLLLQLAVTQLARVEDRLVALFSLLADRWGQVGADGVQITLRLTHNEIGSLIGARRPTVTLTLRGLAEQGRLRRVGPGTWLLANRNLTVTH